MSEFSMWLIYEIWLPYLIVFFTFISIILLCLPSSYEPGKERNKDTTCVQVLVLGDIGRSPRIQYHALSIANNGGEVELIGYQGTRHPSEYLAPCLSISKDTEIHPQIASNPHITVCPVPFFPKVFRTEGKWLFLLQAPLKVAFQMLSLIYVLGYRTKAAKWMIIQVSVIISDILASPSVRIKLRLLQRAHD